MPKLYPNEWVQYGYSEEDWKALNKTKRWRIRNPGKQADMQRSWVARNQEYNSSRQRQYQLRDKYGITEKDYNDMLIEQNNQCAICETKIPTGKWKVFAVDHCHTTGNVRGLLCNECNRGMGLLGDSVERLLKAIYYLNKTKTKKENNAG